MGKAFLIVPLFLFAGCNRHDPETLEESSRLIEADLRRSAYIEALNRAKQGQQDWRDQPQSEGYVSYRLFEAEALMEMGNSRDAAPLLSSLSPPTLALRARRDIDLGGALLLLGKFKSAAQPLDSGLEAAENASLHELYLTGMRQKGSLLRRTGHVEEAEQVYRAALTKAEEWHDTLSRAKLMINFGILRQDSARYDEAVPYFQQAYNALSEAETPALKALCLSNLGTCYGELGDVDQAQTFQVRALAILERTGVKRYIANAYGEVGRIYDRQGDLRNAVAYYKRALDLAREIGMTTLAANNAVNLSSSYIQLEDWANAEAYNESARVLGADSKDDLDSYVTLNAASIAAGRGRLDEAQHKWQGIADEKRSNPVLRWGAFAELGKLCAARGDARCARQNFENAIAAIARRRLEIDQEDFQLTFLTEPIRIYQEYVDILMQQGDWKRALQVADSSRAQVLAQSQNARNGPQATVDVSELQRIARSANVVVLSYWLAPRHSYAWVVSGKEAHAVSLSVKESEIREWISRYRNEIQNGRRKVFENPDSYGWRIQEALIKPVQDWIPRDSHVIVIPDGALHYINLETLPAQGGHYWIEQVTLSVAPSLSVLMTTSGTAAIGRGALIVGDAEPVDQYTRLPNAAREIASIQAAFLSPETNVLARQAAIPERYRAAHPEQFALIHFAAHAEANDKDPLDSAVILSPGANGAYKLYARDIYQASAPLRANLVTVSACTSAGSKSYSGEGLIGFAWAFLHAGARNVIAGLWRVDDRSTAILMDHMYAALKDRKQPAEALRAAKLELMHAGGNLSEPYYWGPFQVYRRSVR